MRRTPSIRYYLQHSICRFEFATIIHASFEEITAAGV
jgi:hypothetical protein